MTTRRIALAAFVLGFATLLGACTESSSSGSDAPGKGGETKKDRDETPYVRLCYDMYKKAILGKNGKAATAVVDRNTLDYYGRMRELALTADRVTVTALSLMDRLMVFTLRHRMPADQLEAMNAEGVFAYGVDEGWIGEKSVVGNRLGDVKISGDTATGVHLSEGAAASARHGIKWTFRKEGNDWKLDLTSMMSIGNMALKEAIKRMKLSEDEFIMNALESVSGKKVSDSIWEPMR